MKKEMLMKVGKVCAIVGILMIIAVGGLNLFETVITDEQSLTLMQIGTVLMAAYLFINTKFNKKEKSISETKLKNK